jgi:AbrB family looped-hinge helix DNA binding protein
MASFRKSAAGVSTNGHVTPPKLIRQRWGWGAGTRLLIEETAEGVLLKPASHFPLKEPHDVYASLPFSGKAKTIDELKAGVLAEAKRRHRV